MATPVRKARELFPADFVPIDEFDTKAELENNPREPQSCPPALHKKRVPYCYDPERRTLRRHKARLVRFREDYPAKLSPNYDINSRKKYVTQVYEVPYKIGEGSFGKVYRAKSKEDGKVYALKKLNSTHGVRADYREVSNLEKLGTNATNCVKFYMAWAEDGVLYLKLEYCPLSLAQYCYYNHNISEEVIWYMIHDITLALHYLHKRDLVHLDVKPGNIMITYEGSFKLGDFGLLCDVRPQTLVRLPPVPKAWTTRRIHLRSSSRYKPITLTTKIPEPSPSDDLSEGDCRYLSPEILRFAVRDPCCDMFAFGMTILEICCDMDLPPYGDSWQMLRQRIFPEDLLYFSKDLIALVCDLLNPDYKKRLQIQAVLDMDRLQQVKHVERSKFHEPYVNDFVAREYDSDYDMKYEFGDFDPDDHCWGGVRNAEPADDVPVRPLDFSENSDYSESDEESYSAEPPSRTTVCRVKSNYKSTPPTGEASRMRPIRLFDDEEPGIAPRSNDGASPSLSSDTDTDEDDTPAVLPATPESSPPRVAYSGAEPPLIEPVSEMRADNYYDTPHGGHRRLTRTRLFQ